MYATAWALKMKYYNILLYEELPMGISGSPDISQQRKSDVMQNLAYVRAYLDNTLDPSTDEEHPYWPANWFESRSWKI